MSIGSIGTMPGSWNPIDGFIGTPVEPLRDTVGPANTAAARARRMLHEASLALALEKVVMGLILSLIVMVASLNIVGMLILVVVTRTREISILRAMGASAARIRQIFMLEGVLIGLVGTTIGTVLGLIGCEGLRNYEFPLDTDVYYLDTLPVVVQYDTVGVVAASAVLICFLATLYPATLAARIRPVDGLRYE